MTAKLLEGKVFATQIKADVKNEIAEIGAKFGVQPGLAVVIVGDDAASKVYVASKERNCQELGVYSEVIQMPEDTTKDELLAKIAELNHNDKIHGILVQLPLPEQIRKYETEIIYAIDPAKDVDGFHPQNVGRLGIGDEYLVPCTPYGCIKMMELAGIDIRGKHAVIVGRSNIVGKPMCSLLLSRHATVTICHSQTVDLKAMTQCGDILVAAVGRPNFITADMVKPGAVVIDVGINRIAPKKLVGDVDFEGVKEVASAITPVPGGVGLLTLAVLMHNTVKAAKAQLQK